METVGEEISFITKVKPQSYVYKYKWTIQNFNMNSVNTGNFLKSPTFETSYNEGYLKLYPNGLPVNPVIHNIAVALHIKTIKDPSADVHIDFSILNDKSEMAYTKTGYHHSRFPDSDIGCIDFIKKTELYDPSKKLLIDNQVTIVCSISLLPADLKRRGFRPLTFNKDIIAPKFNLINELQTALNNKFLTDITLVVDGQEMHAHKLILATRSSVFAVMLEADMKEKESSRIEIEDTTADNLSKMLEYMYTDHTYIRDDEVQDMLYLANKYDIKGLKLLCEQNIIRSLNYEFNYINAFKLAETYNCDVLRKGVMKYIIENASSIVGTSRFESWKKDLPPMVVEMIEANA